MFEKKVVVRAPSTLSNLGSGFDVFGLALKEPFDLIEARRSEQTGVTIDSVTGIGAKHIPRDPRRNSAGVAARRVLEAAEAEFGIAIKIKKGIRPCSGIGSSGASAAGGAYAANLLLPAPLPLDQLVVCAARAEEVTSGSFHADNVGPAILGGFTIISSYEPFEIVRVDPPRNLGIVISMPEILVSTKDARKALPSSLGLDSLVFQVAHASGLVLGMRDGDVGLVGRSMKDAVVEPARAHLIPHLREAEEVALRSGAAGAFLGGSGPCIAAVFDSGQTDGKAIADSVSNLFIENGIACRSWVTGPGSGCRRVE
ncbi:MAG: homoserine kinase [Euryarchaeota archaeon]|nr:homoserine kinase [Euryarchaeota archaeon]